MLGAQITDYFSILSLPSAVMDPGKVAWAAPEVLDTKEFSKAADVYSCALLMCQRSHAGCPQTAHATTHRAKLC